VSDDDANRRAILRRRERFVRMALIGATAAATGTACVCLTPPLPDASVARTDAGTDAATDAATDDGSTP
jgi:hypothetical protein